MSNYWNNLTPGNRNLLKLISLFFIVLALPLTVWVVGQTQNTQQKAASVDQLEAEGGVLGGNATIVTDTNASGGKSVLFSASTPTTVPTLTPVPTPAATPTPNPSNPWSVPFGTRPLSGAINLSNCSNVVIENKTFKDLGAGVISIKLQNCSHVTIRSVDFINVAEGVYAVNSSDINIIDSRYSNITGPAQPRTGANVANFVQFNKVAGGLIHHNKGKGGNTEDIVSVYQSSNIIVEDNQFEGTNWTSNSGSGIALSDGGGGGNIARRNTLLNPGQVGIFIAGGTNSKIENNIIYQGQRTNSNISMYIWNQSSSPCSGNSVTGNRVYWKNASGSNSPYWNAGNCGIVIETPANILTDTSLNPTNLAVSL